MNTPHPTVRLSHGHMSADIDVEIAPIILGCWELGIETVYCCQDFMNTVSIVFRKELDAWKFSRHLDSRRRPEGVPEGWADVFRFRSLGNEHPGISGDLKMWNWTPYFEMEPPLRIKLQFPRYDLPEVLKCFEK